MLSKAPYFLSLWIVLGGLGCSARGVRLDEVRPLINETYKPGLTVVQSGDTLEVRFTNPEGYSQTVVVQADGRASFLRLGDILCAGRTPSELTNVLTQAYVQSRALPAPELTVVISEAAPRNVFVVGEVLTPGEVPYPNAGISLLEALGNAGGFRKSTANLGNVTLVRWLPDQKRRAVWYIDARPQHWEGMGQISLLPNDFVYVPNTAIDKTNIWVDKYIRQMIPIPVPAIPLGF